jgi:uncharacterized protein YndB with AHSA1/START domain
MADNPGDMMKEDLVVSRIIDAPLALVWKAWTEPEHVMRWWGPKHWTSPSCKIDLRVGGMYIFCMQAPPEQGGMAQYLSGVYTKIVPMQLLEYTSFLSDKDGKQVDPTSLGMPPEFPKELRNQIVFKAKGELTELVITEFDWPMSPMYVYSLAGMHQTIDKLAASLAKA